MARRYILNQDTCQYVIIVFLYNQIIVTATFVKTSDFTHELNQNRNLSQRLVMNLSCLNYSIIFWASDVRTLKSLNKNGGREITVILTVRSARTALETETVISFNFTWVLFQNSEFQFQFL